MKRIVNNLIGVVKAGRTAFLVSLLLVPIPVLSQEYDVNWHTIDGGGEMSSTGGPYELGGTIGQPDAGVMTGSGPGGTYALTGGFWAISPCWCLADINNDGLRNGEDVQAFVDCMTGAGFNCACTDVVTDGVLDMADASAFVNGLLSGLDCP